VPDWGVYMILARHRKSIWHEIGRHLHATEARAYGAGDVFFFCFPPLAESASSDPCAVDE